MSRPPESPFDLTRIFDALPGCFLVLAPDSPHFTVLAVTDAFLRDACLDRQNTVGRSIFDIYSHHSHDPTEAFADLARASFQRVLDTRTHDVLGIRKFRFHTPNCKDDDFEERYWQIANFPFLDPQGAVACIIHRVEDATEPVRLKHRETQQHAANVELRGAHRAALNLMEDAIEARRQLEQANASLQHEIAERRRAEDSLRESEDSERQRAGELQAILDTVPIAIWIAHDPECRRITGNAAAHRLFGTPPNSNVALNAPPGERIVHYQMLRRGTALTPDQIPARIVTVTGKPLLAQELEIVFEDGRRIFVIQNAVPLLDFNGRVRGAIIADEDVTDRKRNEDAFRQSEEALRQANAQLEARVARRTAQLATANTDLRAQMDAYRRLEAEIARLVEDERLHLGMELHDNLCQQLAATAISTAALLNRLRDDQSPHADTVARLLTALKQAGNDAHALARGLLPVQVEADGLMVALAALAQRTREMHNISCAFECSAPVFLASNALATHLFRITQEAIHNAVKHGKAKQIVISLSNHPALTLTIRDDGVGIPPESERTPGSGLRLMAYRARIIGAAFAVQPASPTGTLVRIDLPPSP